MIRQVTITTAAATGMTPTDASSPAVVAMIQIKPGYSLEARTRRRDTSRADGAGH
jgi:hypothetical protein